ncbi:Lrp/AsnC family transcriptional regulator [Streptomyces sp. NBC_00257]|uniref:Lrp/AsnC family transcriptional regulator n=1 Tax=unclassified Streptomyces TaxID=2593676 RepID=UPI002250769E|nr:MULTISPECIES: AsnC family transcriptional regulator [unclassified Streptomyces]WSX07222.1 Lrp/AsnC family transcriptional regulator [Streptomyces sp. NBC_00987]WTB59935.1 Lrp/AsnC family transcriptional regulator [Streptomyces sp. NBC_00826]WTH95479.1 Lrp/AsnC family transcriptional regulator [Streptomyces sp. NBC_00825]WTI04210.1 Lrp/AsnC family transcriptional regulator [Streptomyces sp. NBC_00822]MCX4870915.1 Lrp/AsnC family transcriptional regulator [Streptomyces sp. NBC_00906]
METDRLLDETDLALLDALQVSPRASWTKLGEVLGAAPITLARRWQRLVDTGAAWISVAGSNARSRGAIVEFVCAPGTEMTVAAELAELPYASTVGITTGDYHVYANIVASTLAATTEILLHGLPLSPHVMRTRSHVFGSLFGGMVWRLGVMNRSQTQQIREVLDPPQREVHPLGAPDRALFLALGRDGRRTYTDLAEELGTTPKAVQRRLNRLERNGDIAFRCDVARALAGWHTMALLWLTVPDAELRTVGNRMAGWAETRMCAAVASPTNLAAILNLRSFEHLEEILIRIATSLPGVTVTERRLVLRQVKIYGRLVDEDGRSIGVIPPDPWADPQGCYARPPSRA